MNSIATVARLLEEQEDEKELRHYVDRLPDNMVQAADAAVVTMRRLIYLEAVDSDNFFENAEAVVDGVVYDFGLKTENELVNIDIFNALLKHILENVPRPADAA